MTKTPRRRRLKKFALTATATIAATFSLAACSTSTPGPTTGAAGKPASSAPAAGQAGGCELDPSSAQMPSTKKFEPVPANARISVALSGIPSGTVKPGAPATEVDVTLCNDSPVDYHKVGVVVVLTAAAARSRRSGSLRAPANASIRPPAAG